MIVTCTAVGCRISTSFPEPVVVFSYLDIKINLSDNFLICCGKYHALIKNIVWAEINQENIVFVSRLRKVIVDHVNVLFCGSRKSNIVA